MRAPGTLGQRLQAVSALLPALAGLVGPALPPQTGLAAALLEHWRASQPQAGPQYWAARSWGMLIWQPAYLSVLALHCAGGALSLHGLQQHVAHGSTSGFSLPEQLPACGDAAAQLAQAAQQLLAYQQLQLERLQALQPYSTYLAHCLTADCVLAALQLAGNALGWNAPRQQQHAEQWLTTLQLTRHGTLMQIEIAPGQYRTALARKGCCQHFRLPGAEACSDCPRWPMPERIRRIRQQWQAEACARSA